MIFVFDKYSLISSKAIWRKYENRGLVPEALYLSKKKAQSEKVFYH
jgi:hypothetical protein